MDAVSIQKRFGLVVAEHRGKLGLTQQQLAEKCGLHRTYIADIECGGRNVTIKNVEKIAQALNVPMALLLPESSEAGTSITHSIAKPAIKLVVALTQLSEMIQVG